MWNKTEQRMKPLIRFVILFSILLTGCNRHAGDIRLEQALTFAGENRSELEKVLDRYASDSADSLKYRAARLPQYCRHARIHQRVRRVDRDLFQP